MHLTKFISLVFLIPTITYCTQAQTTLSAGDIAITGFNSDAPDGISFVLLVDVAAGTQVCFTDNGWNCTGGWRTGEGTLCWTAPTGGATAGAQIVMQNSSGWTVTNGCGTVSGTSIDLSNSGDQIIAYQGPAASPTFLYGLNYDNVGWKGTDPANSNESCLPTGLTNGTNAISLGNDIDNQKYNCSTTSASKATLLTAISTTSNWSGSDASAQTLPPCGSFSVSGSTPSCGGGGGGGSSDTCIVVNEFQVNPTCAGCDGAATNTGEWIEIYNKCSSSVDISCYVVCLTDESSGSRRGDCITIPSGTTLADSTSFWLGGNKTNCSTCDYPAGTWGSLDLNWHTCSGCVVDVDGDGSGYTGVLTNSGEDIAIFDASGNFVNGVTFANGIDGGGMGSSQTVALTASGGCGAKNVTIPASTTLPNVCNGTGGVGYMANGEGCARRCDGTWELRTHPGTSFNPGVSENCTVLPLGLIHFTASVVDDKVRLNWITLSEYNSDYFEIQRSNNGVDFEKMGELDADDNSNTEKRYSFTDTDPGHSVLYYRLKQMKFNRDFAYSNVVSVRFTKKYFLVTSLFPNPVQDVLMVKFSIPEKSDVTILITDVLGKAVLQKEFRHEGWADLTFNISDLPNGIYLLKVSTASGQQQAKFIKSQ